MDTRLVKTVEFNKTRDGFFTDAFEASPSIFDSARERESEREVRGQESCGMRLSIHCAASIAHVHGEEQTTQMYTDTLAYIYTGQRARDREREQTGRRANRPRSPSSSFVA